MGFVKKFLTFLLILFSGYVLSDEVNLSFQASVGEDEYQFFKLSFDSESDLVGKKGKFCATQTFLLNLSLTETTLNLLHKDVNWINIKQLSNLKLHCSAAYFDSEGVFYVDPIIFEDGYVSRYLFIGSINSNNLSGRLHEYNENGISGAIYQNTSAIYEIDKSVKIKK